MSAKTLTGGITYLYHGFNLKPCNGDRTKRSLKRIAEKEFEFLGLNFSNVCVDFSCCQATVANERKYLENNNKCLFMRRLKRNRYSAYTKENISRNKFEDN